MTSLDEAVMLEIQDKPVAAADAYEQVIREGRPAPVEAYTNLAFLYWDCTDYGVLTGFGFEWAFVERASRRAYHELLPEAEAHYPLSCEVKFWQLFFPYMGLGEPDIVTEIEALLRNEELDRSLVPYFYLFNVCGGSRYYSQTWHLYHSIYKLPTWKNRYMLNFIMGPLWNCVDAMQREARILRQQQEKERP